MAPMRAPSPAESMKWTSCSEKITWLFGANCTTAWRNSPTVAFSQVPGQTAQYSCLILVALDKHVGLLSLLGPTKCSFSFWPTMVRTTATEDNKFVTTRINSGTYPVVWP